MVDATTKSCADALLHHWISRHGLASRCTSDNGVNFVSEVWKEMQTKLGIQLNFTSLYSPQANGLLERQHQTLKTSLKAALVEMGELYQDKWYDYLPWVLLMKRASFQKELQTSPAFLCYGTNPAIPGDLLVDPEGNTEPDLKKLINYLHKHDNLPPNQTTKVQQELVPEPPLSVTHVYTKQHNTTGLQAPYCGPFPIVERPSRSTVKIKVGLTKSGEDRCELRHWRDLKVAHMGEATPEASRPARGRPSAPKPSTDQPQSEAQSNTEPNKNKKDAILINKPTQPARPVRSTRNQNPVYVDSLTEISEKSAGKFKTELTPRAWSASSEELAIINASIGNVMPA